MSQPDSQPPAGDRRPIAARRLAFSRTLTSLCIRAGLSPNAISVLGMIAGLAAGCCLAATARFEPGAGVGRVLWFGAAALIQLRLLANMLDGMVAVESGTTSRLGELLNEIPDRVSDTAVLMGLGWAMDGAPIWGIAASLLAMATAYLRAVGKTACGKSFFVGPMAKQHRMFCVTVVAVAIAIAPSTLLARVAGLPKWALVFIAAGCAITCVRRLAATVHALQQTPQ